MLLAAAWAGQRVVAVGQGGTVVLSDDGGLHWQQADSVPTSATLTDVKFSDARNGWAVGHLGVVLHTTDAGRTWTRQLDGNIAAKLTLKAVEEHEAGQSAEAAARALRLARMMVDDGPNKPFLAIGLTSADTIEAFGAYGLALSSNDGGRTWTSIVSELPDPNGFHFYGTALVGNERIVVGERGTLLRGPDGHQLLPVVTPYSGTLFGLLKGRNDTLIAFGLQGTVLTSRDAGSTWSKVDSGLGASIQAGTVLSDGTIVLGSEGGQLVASRDDGQHFVPLKTLAQPAAGMLPIAKRALLVLGPRGAERVDLSAETELK
ncbi:WD40/YVTN/BNR-like repeat-containing protein [Paraburkholderia sp. SG-MS1]|uniref:WD40/YVTN/BNR-like repeat-containing protein n=1 Tax=Paraburkholderia sp. SG-MS1 TaxID=2023741 RepID=UPI00144628CB|nr:YCF48-related protein [Paraburkholderia sp. SG-MS1]